MTLLTVSEQVAKLDKELDVRSAYNYFLDYRQGRQGGWHLEFIPVLANKLAILEDMSFFNEEVFSGIGKEAVAIYLNGDVKDVFLKTPMPVMPVHGLDPKTITCRRILGEMSGIPQKYQDGRWVRLFYQRKYAEEGHFTDDYRVWKDYVLVSRSEGSVNGRDRKDSEKMIGMFALGMNEDEMLKRFPTAVEEEIFFETYKIEDLTKFGIFRPVEASEQESKGKVIWGPGYTWTNQNG